MRTPSDNIISRAQRNGAELPPSVYFVSLEVENIRCFGARQTLDLSDGNDHPRQWTILLGDNGVGKTTLLQCLAGLQLSENRMSDGGRVLILRFLKQHGDGDFMKSFFVGRHGDEASHLHTVLSVSANLTSPTNGGGITELSVKGKPEKTWSTVVDENLRGLICYGYGARRRMGSGELSEAQATDTTLSLFDDNATLINAEEWLLQADYAAKSLDGAAQKHAEKRQDRIKEMLIRLLPDVSELRFAPSRTTPIRTTVQAQTPYGWVPIKELSLGYRTLMTWMVDFASRLFERYPDSPDPLAEPAIALIDEIDLHLHPRWQRTLMQFLSELFPNTQFIASAHSPLVVQAATDANVVLLRREGDHVVTCRQTLRSRDRLNLLIHSPYADELFAGRKRPDCGRQGW